MADRPAYFRRSRLFEVIELGMGLTHLRVKIANPAQPGKVVEEQFLVDSGAVYSVVPQTILVQLGIKPHSKKIFTLANGEEIECEVGDALSEYQGHKGSSSVIFGQRGDDNLLGMVTLEVLGMILDPLRRGLKPPPMLLA